jgi:hypothetical protein
VIEEGKQQEAGSKLSSAPSSELSFQFHRNIRRFTIEENTLEGSKDIPFFRHEGGYEITMLCADWWISTSRG